MKFEYIPLWQLLLVSDADAGGVHAGAAAPVTAARGLGARARRDASQPLMSVMGG